MGWSPHFTNKQFAAQNAKVAVKIMLLSCFRNRKQKENNDYIPKKEKKEFFLKSYKMLYFLYLYLKIINKLREKVFIHFKFFYCSSWFLLGF